MADETYYSLLEVSEVATATEIKSAYIRLIREVHPDRLANAPAYWQRQAEEKAKEVNEAYTVLSDREKRRLYDAQLASYRSAQATSSGPSSVHQSSPNTAQQQTPPRPPRPAQAQQQAQQQPHQAATTQAAQQGQISSFKAWFWIVWAAWSVVCLVNSNAWMIIVGLPASLFIGTYLEKAQRFVEHRLGLKPRPQQPATGTKVPGGPQKIQSGWKLWFWAAWTISSLLGLAIGQIGETGTPTDHTAVLTGAWYWIGGLPLAVVLAWRRDRIKQWISTQRAAGVFYEKLGAGTAVAFMLFLLSMLPVMSDLNKDRTKEKAPIDLSAGFVRKAEVNEYSTPKPPGATVKQQNPESGVEPAKPFDARYGWYVQAIKNRVAQNWRIDEVAANTTAGATVYITFPVGRAGYPGVASVKASSGWQSLDKSCLNAVGRVGTFGPLPAGYHEKTLNVVYHCTYPGLSVASTEDVAIEKRPSASSSSEQTPRALISEGSDPTKAQSDTINNSVLALSKTLDASTINSSDRASIESACSGARLVQGAAAYHRCFGNQLRALAEAPNSPDLSQLRVADRTSIESACSGARLVQGAAAYHRCLGNQLRALAEAPNAPDLSRLNASDLASIESACSGPRLVQGAAAYHRCLAQQLGELAEIPNKPDLSRLNSSDRASIESACSGARLVQGAAAYHRCLKTQLSELEH